MVGLRVWQHSRIWLPSFPRGFTSSIAELFVPSVEQSTPPLFLPETPQAAVEICRFSALFGCSLPSEATEMEFAWTSPFMQHCPCVSEKSSSTGCGCDCSVMVSKVLCRSVFGALPHSLRLTLEFSADAMLTRVCPCVSLGGRESGSPRWSPTKQPSGGKRGLWGHPLLIFDWVLLQN